MRELKLGSGDDHLMMIIIGCAMAAIIAIALNIIYAYVTFF